MLFNICIQSIFKTQTYLVFSIWSKFSIDTFNYSFTIQTIQKLFSKPEHIRYLVFGQNLLFGPIWTNTGDNCNKLLPHSGITYPLTV